MFYGKYEIMLKLKKKIKAKNNKLCIENLVFNGNYDIKELAKKIKEINIGFR